MRLEALGRFLMVMLLGSWTFAWAQEAKPAQPAPAAEAPPPAEAQPPSAPAPQVTPAAPAPAPEVKPAAPPPAVEPPKPPAFQFAMHGFVGVTLFAQDGVTRPSEGGLAMFAAPQGTGTGTIGGQQPHTDKLLFNGDVRQSRFNFSVAGPEVIGATPRGVLEIDFFGGLGQGNYGSISLTPRMRLAHVELDWGRHRLLFGQQNDLTLPFVSYSLSHLANPLSFVTGLVGWRRPGVFGYHTVAGDRKDAFLEFAWEVGAPLWANNATIGGANAAGNGALAGGDRFGFNDGEASGVPAVEARLLAGQSTKYQVYVTGHYNKVDRSGVGATSAPNVSNLEVVVAQVGAKGVFGPLTLQTQAFRGKNLAPLTGAFLQFQANTVKDINEYGGYVQAGYNFTPEWSVWGMLGSDRIDPEDAREAHAAAVAAGGAAVGTYGVTQNTVSQGFVQYRVDRLGFSLEWTHFLTRTLGTTPDLDAKLKVNQWAFNCIYFM